MNEQKITVIHHSADFDGLFCREIARKFLGDSATYVGWDFADKALEIPEGNVYVMDLPVDRVFGFDFNQAPEGKNSAEMAVAASRALDLLERLIWIDHHKSSIDSHPDKIAGYRIDGVAACRLAWQWFMSRTREAVGQALPEKHHYVDRVVSEPLAVRLAGEYDVWDKRDPQAEVFQFGLRSIDLRPFDWAQFLQLNRKPSVSEIEELVEAGYSNLLLPDGTAIPAIIHSLLGNGRLLQAYQQQCDAGMMGRSFIVEFEGLKFLALNTAWCNSLTFAAKDVPESGHDALMGFYWKDGQWNVSLYHARHRTDIDLSVIASKYGGGGHRGACGFRRQQVRCLPYMVSSQLQHALYDWPSVGAFAERMVKKLEANRHKGDREAWLGCHPWELVEGLLDETVELQQQFKEEFQEDRHRIFAKNPEAAADECADVANFAMMVADCLLNGKAPATK